MGRQINFHATFKDLDELLQRVGQREPFLILHDRSPSATPRLASSHSQVEDGRLLCYYYLVRECDLSLVSTREVPTQGYWLVDDDTSPVLQLRCSYPSDKALSRGRLYCNDSFYGADGTLIGKSEEFRSWATAVFRVARSVFTKHGFWYAGKDAWAQHVQEGVALLD